MTLRERLAEAETERDRLAADKERLHFITGCCLDAMDGIKRLLEWAHSGDRQIDETLHASLEGQDIVTWITGYCDELRRESRLLRAGPMPPAPPYADCDAAPRAADLGYALDRSRSFYKQLPLTDDEMMRIEADFNVVYAWVGWPNEIRSAKAHALVSHALPRLLSDITWLRLALKETHPHLLPKPVAPKTSPRKKRGKD